MSGFNVQLAGLQTTLNRLKKAADEVTIEVDAAIGGGMQDMSKSAKRLAPVDSGFLKDSISAKRVEILSWELVAQSDYAAYIEFGTKGYVKVPGELQAYAAKFRGKKGKGTFEQLVDKLTIWVKRKGIAATQIKYTKDGKVKKAGTLSQGIYERQLAKFIAFIILTKGIKPQPFFFPSVFAYRPLIIKEVAKIVKKKR
jgi:hypothetical protein